MAVIDSIYNLLDDTTEIIVVDNNSSDNTQLSVTKYFDKARYFKSEKNVGASGRNIAFKNALGSVIICLDDDVSGITGEMISRLHTKFGKNPRLGAVNFKVVDAFTGNICNWVHHCKVEDCSAKEFFTYEITEGAVAFRKDALDKAGYYDDIYFISHEGPDLAFRIMREGYDCIYWGDIVVSHRHENSGRASWLNYYYDTRNHIYLAVKNLPLKNAVGYLTVGLLSMLVYSIRDGFFRYWVKAVHDGIKNVPLILLKRKVLPENVMIKINEINENKAPMLYKIKSRLFRKNARL
ncbi:MAG: glycosyltransferase [Proteobacteria bacterium]|nr:glycosyltransferase [Pseudomonadota bacterium]